MTVFNNALAIGLVSALGLSLIELPPRSTESRSNETAAARALAQAALWNTNSPCDSACLDRYDPLTLTDQELQQIGENIQARSVDRLAASLDRVIKTRATARTSASRQAEEIIFPSGDVFVLQTDLVLTGPCYIAFCHVVLTPGIDSRSARAPRNILRLVKLNAMLPVNAFQRGAQQDAVRFLAEDLVAEFAPRS